MDKVTLEFVAYSPAEYDAGYGAFQENITITLEYGGHNMPELIESLRESLRQSFDCETVYTKSEWKNKYPID